MRARSRWLALLGGLALGLVLLAAAAWHDLSMARGQLIEARSVLSRTVNDPGSLRTPDGRRAARVQIDEALGHIESAGKKIKGSMFISPLRVVPGLRTQRAGLLALVDDSRVGALAGRRLLDTADALADRTR